MASGGNPLFIEALSRDTDDAPGLGARAGTGRGPGHPVAAALNSVLDALEQSARTVVLATAVLGPECTTDLLGDVTGLRPAELDDALREAVNAGVLANDGIVISFTHPLYEHAVCTPATLRARYELHACAAAKLDERLARGETVAIRSIAHHVIAAGPAARMDGHEEAVRRAGDEALALGAWGEAARCYEASLGTSMTCADATEAASLHRLAGLSRRGNLQLAEAVAHFEAAIDLVGPDSDPETLAELHLWRIRCGIGSREVLAVVADRGPLEELVNEIEDKNPELAAEALVQLSQSYWVEWRMKQAAQTARRALAIAERCNDHSAYAGAATALSVPQWARYDLVESLATLEDGVAHARVAADSAVLAGGPVFRVPLVLTWLGRFDEAQARALECCAIAEHAHYPLELGLPLAALTQIAVARGEFDQAEQYAHRALLIQRLTGYHWAAGLFLPALAGAHVARGQFDAARETLDTWAETADAMALATIELLSRWVTTQERGLAVQGDPLPRVPRDPMLGADSWAAAVVDIARRESAPGDVRAAHDLLVAVDQHGGVFTSSMVTLVPRVLGVAMDLLGEESQATATLHRAIATATAQRADAERARAEADLASILLRRGEPREAFELLEAAAATFQRLGMTPEAEHAAQLTGTSAVGSRRGARPDTSAWSVVFFTDIVDSTRLTEELGAKHYRARARPVEQTITASIITHGGTIVSGINLGDGFIGLFTTVEQAIAAARQCVADIGSTGLHLHMAIHEGEILVDGPRIYGGAVNYAARLSGLSGPDEILVSTTIHDEAARQPHLQLVDRGEHTLKGIAGPQHLYTLIVPEGQEMRE